MKTVIQCKALSWDGWVKQADPVKMSRKQGGFNFEVQHYRLSL